MLIAGIKPITYSSVLTGLSKSIYDDRVSNGIISSESNITTTIGSNTFTESDTKKNDRVLKAKLDAWSIASSTITYLIANTVVTTAGTATAQTGTIS